MFSPSSIGTHTTYTPCSQAQAPAPCSQGHDMFVSTQVSRAYFPGGTPGCYAHASCKLPHWRVPNLRGASEPLCGPLHSPAPPDTSQSSKPILHIPTYVANRHKNVCLGASGVA